MGQWVSGITRDQKRPALCRREEGKRGNIPNNQRRRPSLMKVINIEAVNLVNMTANIKGDGETSLA